MWYVGWLEDVNVGSNLSDVEILDTMSGQWYHCPSLPHPCSSVSVAIIGNMCFVLGGFTTNHKGSKKRSKNSEVSHSVCLDALVSQAAVLPPVYSEKVLHSHHHHAWETSSDTLLKFNSPLPQPLLELSEQCI